MISVEWETLSRAVVARRVELGYERREGLAEASGIGIRTLGDIERAEQKGYRKSLLAKLDIALSWKPGTSLEILHGPDAALNEGAPEASSTTLDAAWVQETWDVEDLPFEVVRLIRLVERLDDAARSRVLRIVDDVARLAAETHGLTDGQE